MPCDSLPAGLRIVEPTGGIEVAVRDGRSGSVDASPRAGAARLGGSGADRRPRERPVALCGA